MNCVELLRVLVNLDVRVWAERDRLQVDAPADVLTEDLRQALAANKAELLRLFAGDYSLVEERNPPATPLQQAYLVGRQPVPLGGVGCHAYFEFDVSAFDCQKLADAFRAVVVRHEAFQTTFAADGELRVNVPFREPPFQVLDWTALSGAASAARRSELRERLSHQLFDPASWPLFEVLIARMPAGQQWLFFSLDMLVADAANTLAIFSEWQRYYEAGIPSAPAPALGFRQAALDALVRRVHADCSQARSYFATRLADVAGGPSLPQRASAERVLAARFERTGARLTAPAWQAFKAHCKRIAVTPTVGVATLIAEALRMWSDVPGEFVLNITTHERPVLPSGTAPLIGNFTSNILLPVPARAGSFGDDCRALQRELLAAMQHTQLTGVEVARELRREKRAELVSAFASAPVVVTSLLGHEAHDLAVWPGEPSYGITQTPQVAIDFQISEGVEGLCCNCDFVAELFPSGMLQQLMAALGVALAALAHDERRWAARRPIDLPDEQRARRAAVNATHAALPVLRLEQRFVAQARERPEATALIAGDVRVSYGVLLSAASALAQRLRAAGVGPGVPVAVSVPKGVEQIAGVLAVLLAGGAYVPVDPELPEARRADLLRSSACVHVILLEGSAWAGSQQKFEVTADVWAAQAEAPESSGGPEDLAYILFTSGSTGTPKGVMMSHAAANNTVAAVNARFAVGPSDRVLGISALSFDLSVYDIFGTLGAGGTLVLPPAHSEREPDRWLQLCATHGVTIWNSVPRLFEMFVESAGDRPVPGPLRLALLSGDFTPVALARRVRECWHELQLVCMGGATEAAIWSIAHAVKIVEPHWPTIPYGRPLPDQRFAVVDSELEDRPDGVLGELLISGRGLADGYSGDPALTERAFVRRPTTGERVYRSGDYGRYLPDGQIEIVGRRDGQVKIGGYRIELGDVEAALERHPEVRTAAALVAEGSAGETVVRSLRALVVPQPGRALDPEALASFAGTQLPSYMVPHRIHCVEALPLTHNGKLDRKRLPGVIALLDRDADEAPAVEEQVDRQVHALEQTIVRIWSNVIGVSEIRADANFFDIGGDSLLMARVHRLLVQELGRDVSVLELYRHPKPRLLAARLASECPALAALQRTAPRERTCEPIAIVGMSCRFPGAGSAAEFWQNILGKVEGITPFDDAELIAAGVPRTLLDHPRYVKAGAVLDDIAGFDAALFGITAREAELMDPQHRLFLECCWEALEDACVSGSGERTGVFAGCNVSTYWLSQSARLPPGDIPRQFELLIGNDKDYLPTRVSYRLNLRGPSIAVSTACSTSLVAVTLGCQALHAQTCDVVLAGGSCINVPHRTGYLHHESAGSLSADGHCRAFDAASSGAMLGNGVGVVVLKRLSDALADGNPVWAVIRSSALCNDGDDKVGFMAPSVSGHRAAIREALESAAIDARSIGFVETHGTGTAMGDPIEVAALTAAFRADTAERGFCALGSVKTNIGHAGHAAGVASLIKASFALHAKLLPPNLHFERPNPALELSASPFYVPTETRPWPSDGALPRRAAISSLGIGGTNAHLILEEALAETAPEVEGGWQLLPVSAKTRSALEASALRLAERLEGDPPPRLGSVARTLQHGRRELTCRGFVVARSAQHAAAQLRDRRRSNWDRHAPATPAEVVFVFPGLGAVDPRVLSPLAAQFPVMREALASGVSLARERLGFDLSGFFTGEAPPRGAQLTAAGWVALLVTEYALSRLLVSLGLRPAALIGHSSGEFAAACASGSLALGDACALVGRRAELARGLAADGGMLTVNLPAHEIVRQLGGEAEIAAFNADDVCLLAGTREELQAWEAKLRAAGPQVICQRSPLPYAAHSRFVEPGLPSLAALCRPIEMAQPELPWISTVTGRLIAGESARAEDYWVRHAREPVRFVQAIGAALEVPGRIFIEVGPGGHLSSLVARIARTRGVPHVALGTLPGGGADPVEYLLNTVGRLWALGTGLRFQALGASRTSARLPTYPFEHKHYWLEAERAGSVATADTQAAAAPHLYRPVWKRTPFVARGSSQPQATLILGPDHTLCEQLARAVRVRGRRAIRATFAQRFRQLGPDAFELDAAQARDAQELLTAILDRESRALRVVIALTEQVGLRRLMSLLQGLARGPLHTSIELCLLTRNAFDVFGCEPLDPIAAGCSVSALVAPREWPQISARCVDLDDAMCWAASAAESAQLLLDELDGPAGWHAVAYRFGKRWQRSYERLPACTSPSAFRSAGVYVITGGLGSLGQVIASHLAREYGARLVLTHRRTLPARSKWDKVSQSAGVSPVIARTLQRLVELERAGAEVRTAQVDVADRAGMRALFADVTAQWGQIHGVLHLAASLEPESFASLASSQEQTLARNFDGKVAGAEVLADLCPEFDVEFCALASSLAAELGGFGNFAYGAANRALDALAAKHDGAGAVRWLSVNWDAFQSNELSEREPRAAAHAALVTPALRALLAQGALRAADVPIALERALAARGEPQVIACSVPIEERLAPLLARAEGAADGVSARPDLSSAYVAPTSDLQRSLVEIWEAVIGVAPIGVEDSFFELGGDSLIAVRLISRCSEQLGLSLAIDQLVREPTIAGVCRIAEQRDHGLELFALKQSGAPRRVLICVPYAGGTAFAYEPLARFLPDDYDVWVVPALREASDPEQLLGRVLSQVTAFRAPISIYGHCGGVVTAFELARRIEASGVPLQHLFAGGMFPDAMKANGIELSAEVLGTIDDSQLFAFIETLGGLPGALGADELRPILVGMREDARLIGNYFGVLDDAAKVRLRAPIACLVGSVDPITRGWEQHAASWRRYSHQTSTHLVEGGGHYFVTVQAERVADIVTALLDEDPTETFADDVLQPSASMAAAPRDS